jgi:hypothetical protein
VIDFRYHLISIVAVFLALGIGILMGSFVLGEGLVNQLDAQLHRIDERNKNLQALVGELQAQVDRGEGFARISRDYLIANELQGEQIVLFTFEGVDGALLDQVRTSVEEAGGVVATTIAATDKLALDSAAERDQLALILASAAAEGVELRTELGEEVGRRAAVAAEASGGVGFGPADRALGVLLSDLAEAEFTTVERSSEEVPLVPPGASFVVAGGSPEEAPFRIAEYSVALATRLASQGAPVAAAEPSTSAWGLSTMLRVDDDAQNVVSTVDNADTIQGSIALVLGLEQAEDGIVGHYGVGPDAQAIIPEPPASS